MSNAAPAADVQNFWVPIAQIVPVFALALVLEARRAAVGWLRKPRWRRRAESITFGTNAISLTLLEATALLNMISPKPHPGNGTFVGVLIVVMALLVLTPVGNLAVSANADVLEVLARAMPWSGWRREGREIEHILTKMADQTDKLIAHDEEVEDHQKSLTEADERFSRVEEQVAIDGGAAFLASLTQSQRDEIEDSGGISPWVRGLRQDLDQARKRTRKMRKENNRWFQGLADDSARLMAYFDAHSRLTTFSAEQRARFNELLRDELVMEAPWANSPQTTDIPEIPTANKRSSAPSSAIPPRVGESSELA